MSSLCLSPKGLRGRQGIVLISAIQKKQKKNPNKSLCFWTQVETAMLILDKRRLENSCSGLISCLWYVLYKKDVWRSLFSLFVWIRVERVQPPAPPPTSTPVSPRVPVGSNKEGGQGKGQAWSSIGERRWHRKQSRRQMDQQMVSFRRIPEDDRAEGHIQRERETEKERGGLRLKRFLPFFSCGSPSCSVITKGQQLLQASLGCCGERQRRL